LKLWPELADAEISTDVSALCHPLAGLTVPPLPAIIVK
jgi:hypothetical protein